MEGAHIVPGPSLCLNIGLQRFWFQTEHKRDFVGADTGPLTECPLTGRLREQGERRKGTVVAASGGIRGDGWLTCLGASSHAHSPATGSQQGSWALLIRQVSDQSFGAIPWSIHGLEGS